MNQLGIVVMTVVQIARVSLGNSRTFSPQSPLQGRTSSTQALSHVLYSYLLTVHKKALLKFNYTSINHNR